MGSKLLMSTAFHPQMDRATERANRSIAQILPTVVSNDQEIPQEEEDNLNESSGEDKEMYSWDELENQFTTTEQGSKKDPGHCRNAMITNLSRYSGR